MQFKFLENYMLQSESLKKMNTNTNMSMNRTTSKASTGYRLTNKLDVLSFDKFNFKF